MRRVISKVQRFMDKLKKEENLTHLISLKLKLVVSLENDNSNINSQARDIDH